MPFTIPLSLCSVYNNFAKFYVYCLGFNYRMSPAIWLAGCVIGERRETQILKCNPPYTLSLQCPSYNKFSQLSYEPGCSHELWCRKCATWLWNKYLLFFLKLYFMHISKDILLLRAHIWQSCCEIHPECHQAQCRLFGNIIDVAVI